MPWALGSASEDEWGWVAQPQLLRASSTALCLNPVPARPPAAYLEVNAAQLLARGLPMIRASYEFAFLDQSGVGWGSVRAAWARPALAALHARQPAPQPISKAAAGVAAAAQEGLHYTVDCGTDTFTPGTANWGKTRMVPLEVLRAPGRHLLDHDRLAIRVTMRVVPPPPAAAPVAAAQAASGDEDDSDDDAVVGL